MYIQEFYYKNTILWQSHEILILFQNHKLLSGGSFCSSRYFKAQFCLFFKSLLSQFQTDTSPPKTIWYTVFHYSLSGWVTPFSMRYAILLLVTNILKWKLFILRPTIILFVQNIATLTYFSSSVQILTLFWSFSKRINT